MKRLAFEPGAKLKPHEKKMVEWILQNLGGRVVVKRRSNVEGKMTADIVYDGRLAEIKATSGTLSTLDGQVRRAIKQAKGDIVFVDITGASYTNKEALRVIEHRMYRSDLKEAYVLRNWKLVKHMIWPE